MRDIRRPDSTEAIVERLTDAKLTDVGDPVFKTIMELLIFAAGVGFAVGRRTAVPLSGKAVPFRIFQNNQKDGYIFLLALAELKTAECLASDDDKVAEIFEEYAATGLEEIGDWLNDNPTDISGVQTLIARIQSRIETQPVVVNDPDPL